MMNNNKIITIILMHSHMASAASNNFLNKDWWKTATIEDVKKELKNGANVNAASDNDTTALMHAAIFNQNPEVIKTLIDEGADVNAKNKDGSTALMFAASSQKNPDAVKALLKAGADANVIDNDGNIAAVFAALNKNPEIHSLILQAMDIEGYCKLTKNNSFDIGLCIDEMKVYAQKEYMLPDCTSNMPAMLYLTPIINAFANNAPNERKIIGWLTLAESAKRFNCSLGKTMYITMGGEDINKEMEEGMKEVQQITK